MTLNYVIAYLGGLLTFLAPCGAFLLPAFLSYAFDSKAKLSTRTLVFYFGLLTSLLPLGFIAGSLSLYIRNHSYLITSILAVIIIILGVIQVFNIALPLPHFQLGKAGSSSIISLYLLGISYGIAGVGCSGPILGSVLSTALLTGSRSLSTTVMFFYATGVFTPILVLSLLWSGLSTWQKSLFKPRPTRFLGRETTWGNIISGVIFVLLGIAFLWTGGTTTFHFLSETQQVDLETKIITLFSGISNLYIILGLACTIFIVALAWYLREYFRNKKN